MTSLNQALVTGIQNHFTTINQLNAEGLDGKRSAKAVDALHQPMCDWLTKETEKDWNLEYKISDYFGGTHKADIGHDKTTFEFKCFKSSYAKNHKNYLRMALAELQGQTLDEFNCSSIIIYKKGMMSPYQLSGWEKLGETYNVLNVEYDDDYNLSYPLQTLDSFIKTSDIYA